MNTVAKLTWLSAAALLAIVVVSMLMLIGLQ